MKRKNERAMNEKFSPKKITDKSCFSVWFVYGGGIKAGALLCGVHGPMPAL